MKGFKQCEKGHYYKEELDACNYCPKPGAPASMQPTIGDKTQIFGSSSAQGADPDKTVLFGAGGNNAAGQGAATPHKKDLNRTYIEGITDNLKPGTAAPRIDRKVMGWIISYTLDPMGMDYRIYEGNNTIGRDVSNSIVILNDGAVSGKHITILCKKAKFYLKDEMAANGTFLNGQEIAIGVTYDLNDGDEIRLGATTIFKFKSAV